MTNYDYLVVGAGITGITAASILAREKNKTVYLIEKRNHIGGNCYDCFNEDGILIHLYGPHIFHTQHKEVWDFLSQFTEWNEYVHHVKAYDNGEYFTFPINLNTFEQVFKKPFSKESMMEMIKSESADYPVILNAKDMVISRMGKTMYTIFFKNYTQKQWGENIKDLSPDVTARIPIRFNRDDRFFSDTYQGLPIDGYTKMFEKMTDHPNIHIQLNTNVKETIDEIAYKRMIYTGPIDQFFNYQYGTLPYRGIQFKFEMEKSSQTLPVAVVNFPNEQDYTRITEFKHMTLQDHDKTCLCYEYPAQAKAGSKSLVPSYPVLTEDSLKTYSKYKKESQKQKKIIFMGRLGKFEYLNMDVCVKQVLDTLKDSN